MLSQFGLRKKRNEKWEVIQKRKQQRDKVIDIICGILIVPMFYIFTVLFFCL